MAEPSDRQVRTAFTLRTSARGRLRFDVHGMRGRSSFAAAIQSALAATAEVSSATANATSGSLLVSFDPAYDPDVITGIVGAQLETLGDPHDWPAGQAKSVLAQVVDEAVPGWKDRVGPVLWTAGA